MLLQDLQGNYLGWDAAAARIHGYTASEVLNLNLSELIT